MGTQLRNVCTNGVDGRLRNSAGAPTCSILSAIEDRDTVGHIHRFGLVVRDEDGRKACPVVNLPEATCADLCEPWRPMRQTARRAATRAARLREPARKRPAGAGRPRVETDNAFQSQAAASCREARTRAQRSPVATDACAAVGRRGRRQCCRIHSCGGRARKTGKRIRPGAPGRNGVRRPRHRRRWTPQMRFPARRGAEAAWSYQTRKARAALEVLLARSLDRRGRERARRRTLLKGHEWKWRAARRTCALTADPRARTRDPPDRRHQGR